jgi:hypothetical protein
VSLTYCRVITALIFLKSKSLWRIPNKDLEIRDIPLMYGEL